MFSKRIFRRRNKPVKTHFFEGSEKQQEQPFIPPLQTGLNIGEPGGKLEKEADMIAAQVTDASIDSGSIQKIEADEEEVQPKALRKEISPFVQMQSLLDEEEEPIQKKEKEEEVQRKVLGNEISTLVQRQNLPKEEEEPLQAKLEKEEELQRKLLDRRKGNSDVAGKLKNQKGGGNSMDPETRAKMENAFGTDFSQVRIHSDSASHEMNKDLNSKAFTNGKDIYFRNGNYRPDTGSGKQLLAHELVHTIQQGAVNTGQALNNSKHPESIQRKEIPYQALSWDHFMGVPEEGVDSDALTFSGLNYSENKMMDPEWTWNDGVVVVKIAYKASEVDLQAFMETEKSWKRAWLTNDAKARKKFGPDADIDAERKKLLAHEQIHFRISNSIAAKYRPKLRALIPSKDYKEKAVAKTGDAAKAFFDRVLGEKAKEIHLAIKNLIDSANKEKDLIQEIYDTDTNHSEIADKQESWEKKYDKTFQEAVSRAKKKKAN